MKKVVKLLSIGLSYFAPLCPMLYAIIFLFVTDWITGVWKSLKFRKRISSYRLRQSVEKLASYIIVITTTFVFEREFIGDSMYLVKVACGYISATELLSIYENVSIITGKEFLKDLIYLIKDKYLKSGKSISK